MNRRRARSRGRRSPGLRSTLVRRAPSIHNHKMELTLYTRADCRLCDEMHAALAPCIERFSLDLELVDVDRDPELRHRHGARVPVLALDGLEVCHWFLDEDALLARLQGEAAAENSDLCSASPYERIYALVARIPPGRVATYGQLARIEGRCTSRMVGYAMAALPEGRALPWHRVVNARGSVSERRGGGGTSRQEALLRADGLLFDARGRLDLERVSWEGPDWDWAERHGYNPDAAPVA